MDEVRLGSRTLQPRRQLLVAGRREPLGKRALDILSVLAEARGAIVTKDELLEAVWPGVVVEENALQVHVVALRKALGPEADRLRTIRGVGYQLEIDGETGVPQAEGTSASPPTSPPPPSSQPDPVTRGAAKPTMTLAAVWAKARSHRLAMTVAALLLTLAGAWAIFGEDLGLRPQERIPVVVRMLEAEGTRDRTETALASGITDELIVRLRQVPELRIATAETDGSAPSDAFKSAYVVDGTIRSSGDQLRVTARLLNHDGEVLWSQTFDRGLSELFDVQEEIASAIANTLSVSFDVGGNSAEYGGTNNPEAYAAYMQALAHQLEPDFDSRPLLERAIALDPHYAKARSALYGDYGLQISLAQANDKARLLGDMDRNTRDALSANPDLWIPLAARGMYDAYRHDFVSADRRYRQVAALDKGIDPELRSKWANFEMLLGRVRKATSLRHSNELIDPIQRNDPFRIYDLEMLGNYQESIDLFRRLERKEQRGLAGFVFHVSMSLLLSGQEAEAIRLIEQHEQPLFGDQLRAIRDTPALTEMSPAALRTWAEQRYGEGAEFQFAFSALYAGHYGHPKLAVELMRLAFEGPSSGALWALWHPAMAEARKTDEFEQLVIDLGFAKAWRESDDWGDFCRAVSQTEISCT